MTSETASTNRCRKKYIDGLCNKRFRNDANMDAEMDAKRNGKMENRGTCLERCAIKCSIWNRPQNLIFAVSCSSCDLKSYRFDCLFMFNIDLEKLKKLWDMSRHMRRRLCYLRLSLNSILWYLARVTTSKCLNSDLKITLWLCYIDR